MVFSECFPAGAMIRNIEFNKVYTIEKVLHGIQLCVFFKSPIIPLIYFVKNYAREAHLRDIYLEPRQTSNMELFKK